MASIELQLLLLISIANGVPIIAAATCGDRGAWPVDGGRRWTDGRRLLGDTKTWRGVVLAPLATGLGAMLLDWSATVGVVIGVAAMLGDLLSSFVKRRLAIPTSGMALGLDQIPEALLPLLAVADRFALSWPAIAATTAGFIVLELVLSRVLYRLGIRNRPY